MSSKNYFQKIEKTIDDVIFSVSVLVSNFAALEAKIETETDLGLGLGKILRSQSWSRTSRSRLQPWNLIICFCIISIFSKLSIPVQICKMIIVWTRPKVI